MTTQSGNGTTTAAPVVSLVRHQEPVSIQPANFSELRAMAKDAAATRFYGAASPEQAFLLMMTGKDLGLSYSQSLRAFHVIEGRPSLSADGMVAVCLAHPEVCEYFRTLESDDKHATVETKRAGDPPRKLTFTFEEAQRAGLVKDKGGWQKWPSRMCLARAKSFLAREVYPDLLMGLYDPDELKDSAEPRRVEARQARTEPAPPSSPYVTDDGEVVDETTIYAGEIEAKIKVAADSDELDAAAAWVARAEREGKISSDQAKVLARIGKARRAELK